MKSQPQHDTDICVLCNSGSICSSLLDANISRFIIICESFFSNEIEFAINEHYN